jgi:hypothetical protein
MRHPRAEEPYRRIRKREQALISRRDGTCPVLLYHREKLMTGKIALLELQWTSRLKEDPGSLQVGLKGFDMEVSKDRFHVAALVAPVVAWPRVIGKAARARGNYECSAWPNDMLQIAHHPPPISRVLEHLGRNHNVETLVPKVAPEVSAVADLVDVISVFEVDTNVNARVERFDRGPHRAISTTDGTRAYLKDGSPANLGRRQVLGSKPQTTFVHVYLLLLEKRDR